MFNIHLEEKLGLLHIAMTADPLTGAFCLHRDEMKDIVLREEVNEEVKLRDELFFKNMEALEHTLTLATFYEEGVRGDWIVTQDDFISSNSPYRDFFMLDHAESGQKTNATIIYQIKDYDMVGPYEHHKGRTDCHEDGSCDTKPWLFIKVIFSNKHFGELKLNRNNGKLTLDYSKDEVLSFSEIVLEMEFPLAKSHLLINKPKRSFRATKPARATVTLPGLATTRECEDLDFSFQVRSEELIKYVVEDQGDSCFPYTIEGKFYLDLSEEEKIEEKVE